LNGFAFGVEAWQSPKTMPCVNLRGDLQAADPLRLDPDRTIEVLADQVGNRWSRWMAPSGIATLRYSTNPDLQRQP